MVWMTGCAVFNLKLSLSLLSAEVEGWNLRLNVFCRRIKYVEIWQLFPIKKKKSTKMILYFVGSLLTPQSFQSYSLEIVSYSLFSWFWGCFGLKELYHHQTVTVMKSDVMQTLSELVVVWKPGREFTSRLDANVAVVDFACVTAEYLIFSLHSGCRFLFSAVRQVSSVSVVNNEHEASSVHSVWLFVSWCVMKGFPPGGSWTAASN